MKRSLACLILFAVLALPSIAFAQSPTPAPEAEAARQLDTVAASLAQIQDGVRDQSASSEDLQSLHDKAISLVAEAQGALDRLTTRLNAAKTRLDQLGPPPDPKAAHEPAEVTQERQQQQQEYDAADALVKRAKLLLVQAQQLAAHIATRQHVQFTHSLFERSTSLADPDLWFDAAAMTPHTVAAVATETGDWVAGLNGRLKGWRAPTFWLLFAGLAAACTIVLLTLPRRLFRSSATAEPTRFKKIMSGWWVLLIDVGAPLAVILAASALIKLFGAYDASVQPVFSATVKAVAYVAVAAGLGSGLFAPSHPQWRLVNLPDLRARQIRVAMVAVAVLIALRHIALSLCESVGADLSYQAALRGLGALFVALAIIAALWRAGQTDCGSEEVLGPRVSGPRDWYGIERILLWIAALVIVVAAIAGLMTLAGFVADQIYWVGVVGCIALMLSIVIDESIAASCRPTTPFGRALMNSVGLRANSIDQLAILANGFAAVAIFIAAVLLILAPWGVQSSDLPTYLKAAIFGFRFGDLTVSLASLAIALVILVAGIMATHAIERWLDLRFLPQTQLDFGLRNAIRTSFGYAGFVLALCFAGAYLGLSFEKLAIVAGALSVGIGFGLQSIVNNFVSGLILLWERAIRVGDWIVVGNEEGVVSRINVRATEIATFDRAQIIVPNSNLITGVVKNYVRTDRSGRIQISVPVNPAANPETARDVLMDVAKNHKLVLPNPAPQVIFSGITASAFNFDLFCFIADVANLGQVKSDLNFEIYRRFQAAGLFAVPPPASVVTVTGFDKLEPLLERVAEKGAGNGKENR
ncbi:MAG TPA: DUF3772 domain-containing protein [Methylovirgula sp.]